MTYEDQTTQRQHLEQSQPLSSHLSYSSHFRSSAGVHTKLRSSASGRSHQCARRLRVASALATHGALYLADHCTQGQQPRRSCAPLRVGIFARVRSHRDAMSHDYIACGLQMGLCFCFRKSNQSQNNFLVTNDYFCQITTPPESDHREAGER